MKKMVINSASWVKNAEGKPSGNVTGYNTLGERVHIYGRQIEALGLKQGDKLPTLYVIAKETEIVPRNADGTINNSDDATKVVRLTAASVFQSMKDMAKAFAETATLEASIQKEIKQAYSDAGFSAEDIKALGELILA